MTDRRKFLMHSILSIAVALFFTPAGWAQAQKVRVGIMLPNCPQYIIAAFGVLRLGAIVVNIFNVTTEALVASDTTTGTTSLGATGVLAVSATASLGPRPVKERKEGSQPVPPGRASTPC